MADIKKAWMRQLEVIFTSTALRRRMSFGTNKLGEDNLHIVVKGTKYLSSLKDEFTIRIDNLTPKEMTELIIGQYYDVEIKVGYYSCGVHTVFKGGVLYISNVLGDRKSNTAIILCASQMVAKYGQTRMNLSLNSGLNMYNMLEFICKRAGVPGSNISTEFKSRIVRETIQVSNTAGSFIDKICATRNLVVQTDASYNSVISIWDPYRKDPRVIKIEPSTIILTGGYPTLTSDGLKLSLMPTFGFMPGDTIQIDNSIIDMGLESRENNKELNRGYYLDENGKYVIFQIDVALDNRGSDFSYNMLCKARYLMSKAGLNIYGGKK